MPEPVGSDQRYLPGLDGLRAIAVAAVVAYHLGYGWAQGGLLGVGAALGMLSWSKLAVGTEGVTIAFTPSAGLALTGLVVTALVGVLAGLFPAWQASRADIVASLRYT